MPSIPTRAPIDYDDLRRPYNLVRALGGLTFAAALVVWVASTGSVGPLALAVPALAVAIDAWYRRTHERATPAPGIVLDATAIGVALLVYGPDAGIHGVAILTMLVTAALMLPPYRAALVVLFMLTLSIVTGALDALGVPFIGSVDSVRGQAVLDTLVVMVFIGATACVLVLTVHVILRAQDRQDEALAQERRAVQLKNEFVSMVSHELRTPLTGIAGFTDTLSESWMSLPSGEVDEFLSIMGRETDHLANLVEDILVIPRLEAGQLRLVPEELDLAVEAHAVAGVVIPDTDYSVAIPSGVVVRADRTRLRQIMRNLLENAAKYGGDQVLIEGEMSAPGLYTVSVSDNGAGVDPDDRDRIFQHFEQLSTGDARLQQGVGLGLPIARTLTRAMGGDLWYEDRFPMGAKFRFTVTLARRSDDSMPEDASHVDVR